jgi:hypothetical protein
MRKVNDGKCCSPRTLPRPLTLHMQHLAPLPKSVHHLTEFRHLTMQGKRLYVVNELAECKVQRTHHGRLQCSMKQHLQV